VRGSLTFPSDIDAEGILECRPVLAPFPHAELLGIHISAALQVPGVVAVLTHRDVPGPNRYGYRRDHPVLCDDKTRYTGDMVAIVVGETAEAVERGVERVQVLYRPLPVVSDAEQALNPASERVHDEGNILHEVHYAQGNVAEVFGESGVVTVEHTYELQMMDHAFLETEAGVAFPQDGGVRIISGGQNAYADRAEVARCLNLPLDKVQVIQSYTGGAFGGKGDITVEIVVALAALRTERPCRMVWSRREHFLAGVKRHPAKIRLKLAATRDGELRALEARILADTGAYAVFGDAILELMVENITGPYRIPHTKIDAWSVHTNNGVGGAFRGFGATQACFALESTISDLARALGQDAIEFRIGNVIALGDRSGVGHQIVRPIGAGKALEAAVRHPAWSGRHSGGRTSGSVRRGVGVALAMKGYGLGIGDAPDYGAAELEMKENGRILLSTSVADMGQGSYTALAQIAAEVIGCDIDQIDVQGGDTFETLDSGTTAASRVTYAAGRAVVAAAEPFAARLRAAGAQFLGVSPAEVEVRGHSLTVAGTETMMSFDELGSRLSVLPSGSVRLRVPFSEGPTSGALAHPHVLYSSNVQIAQVAVDTDTGEVMVEHVVTFPEVGRVINPLGLEGQCEGGIAQGVGYALLEEVVVREGVIANADLTTYPIPTAADVPTVETIPVETPEETGPFGAKGAGENATLPTAPAIVNGIADAIGIRFTSLPVTPEEVLSALEV
jgi:CO/xanthine dehydrogenase Mo-binding subunit